MNPLEIFANLFNLISVFLANRNIVHTWWIGIIGGILYGVMFYEVKLYADVILQVFFILTNLYGWWAWLHGGASKKELPITRVSIKQLIFFAVLAIVLTVGHGFLLHSLTDASFPFIDSIILVVSIIAQFLLMQRKLESWLFWIIVDAVAVPLYAAKDLYLTSAIYFIFLLNAIWGLINWWKIWQITHPGGEVKEGLMTEKDFLKKIEIVCKNPEMYTAKGSFDEVINFLESYGKKNMIQLYYHSIFTPFLKWMAKKNYTLDKIDHFVTFRKDFSSDEEALKNLPILYQEYVESSSTES